MRRELQLLVSCEHGGNRVPPPYRTVFAAHGAVLATHAGFDLGALAVARGVATALSREWPVRLVYSTTTRLLVDLNRSVGHPRLHGAPIRALPADARRAIVERHHAPYRDEVRRWAAGAIDGGARVVHVSCHSFTPALDGKARDADIGLLFDPRRAFEARFASAWRATLAAALPLRVRFNYPYRGTADGLTTSLRRGFADERYAGIELEVNQRHALGAPRAWRELRRQLAATLDAALRIEARRARPT